MRRQGSLRPTEQGLALAQDAWMLGTGLGSMVEEFEPNGQTYGGVETAGRVSQLARNGAQLMRSLSRYQRSTDEPAWSGELGR
jgi:hypothetical protein